MVEGGESRGQPGDHIVSQYPRSYSALEDYELTTMSWGDRDEYYGSTFQMFQHSYDEGHPSLYCYLPTDDPGSALYDRDEPAPYDGSTHLGRPR